MSEEAVNAEIVNVVKDDRQLAFQFHKNIWSLENIETLKWMREEGATNTQIGAAVGKSRSAVSGMISRLGLPTRPKVEKARPCPRLAVPLGPPKLKVVPKMSRIGDCARELPAEAVPHGLVDLMELQNHHCRWPIAGKFCGDTAMEGSAYCPQHSAIAFRPRGETIVAVDHPARRIKSESRD